jgi:peptidoglycan hydrolase-like protein with peptidoglycan-binding domain
VIKSGNRVADVRTIQIALNRFPPTDGGPSPKLEVDGVVGPRTEYAIEFFQRKWGLYPKGWSAPDVIVDVEGNTIDRLRAGPAQTTKSGKELALATLPRVLAMLVVAQATSRAAIANAKTHGPPFLRQMDPIGQAALATVNSVFKTDGSPSFSWDLTFISSMIDRMHMAASQAFRTQSIFVEEPSYMTSPGSGMAVMGGFFLPEKALVKIDRGPGSRAEHRICLLQPLVQGVHHREPGVCRDP